MISIAPLASVLRISGIKLPSISARITTRLDVLLKVRDLAAKRGTIDRNLRLLKSGEAKDIQFEA